MLPTSQFSAWIVNLDRTKVLMAYHNIYQSWAWLGGHADGNPDVRQVIRKEIEEESGLTDIRFLTDDIFFSGKSDCRWT